METAVANFVASRRIGGATITAINVSREFWAPELTAPEAEWRRAMPEADDMGRIPVDTHVIHIQLGDASILVDAGIDDPASTWSRQMLAREPDVELTPGVQAGLATIGVRPEDITHVLITHFHYDHIVGLTVEQEGRHVPRFPNARVFIGRGDWEGNEERDTPDSDVSVRLRAIERYGLLELVDGDREIIPGVTMIHAPGESPGHSIVRVISDGERFYALGDLYHHAIEVEHPDWMVQWADPAAMKASRQRLVDEAVPSRATLAFTHELFPPWGRIISSNGGYRWVRG